MLAAEGKKPAPDTPLERFREANKSGMAVTTACVREAAAGRNACLYSSDWNGPDTGLGNCHCIELPFLFGDKEAWESAPMLADVGWHEFDRMGRSLRMQWAAFARDSNPGLNWKPATATDAKTTSLS